MKHARGFTLIEILVVIAIIGILTSAILASVSSARGKARDTKRATDLTSLKSAIEMYNTDYGYYPTPPWGWRSQCPAWGGYAASDVIPGLVPTYISAFPTDSEMNTSANTCCHIYISNGTEYTLLLHNCPTISYASVPSLIDSARDSGTDACRVDGTGIWSWAVRSSQVNACW